MSDEKGDIKNFECRHVQKQWRADPHSLSFKSGELSKFFALIAQWRERDVSTVRVGGSSPSEGAVTAVTFSEPRGSGDGFDEVAQSNDFRECSTKQVNCRAI